MGARTFLLVSLLLGGLGLGTWLLLSPRREAAIVGEEGAEGDPTPAVEAMALASRAPAAVSAPSNALEGTVQVTVIDAAGGRVAGVPVLVRRVGAARDFNDPATWGTYGPTERLRRTFADLDAAREEPPVLVSGTSDAQGRCELAVTQTGQYRIESSPPAPRVGSRATVTLLPLEPRAQVTLRVSEGTPLRGRVVDAADRPVSATLTPWWSLPGAEEGWSGARVSTDPATGAFAWPAVPAGKGRVSVLVPGRLRLDVRVTTPREDELLVRLPVGGVVRGTVRDAGGEPIAGADVTLSLRAPKPPEETGAPSASVRAKTGSDGTYRVEGVPEGLVESASALAPGFLALEERAGTATWAGAQVREGAEAVVELVMRRGGAVTGRVVVEGSGAPVADATVTLLPAQNRWNDAWPPVEVDAQGRFRFADVALGRYVLVAASPTHFLPALAPAGASRALMPGQEGDVSDAIVAVLSKEGEELTRDVALRVGTSVRGRVLDPEGAPVAGATIASPQDAPWNTFWRWQVVQNGMRRVLATSADDGTFRIRSLAPDHRYAFVATKSPFAGILSEELLLVAGQAEPEVVLRLEPGAVLLGRVLDPDERPVPGARVNWYAVDGKRQANGQGTTEADGTFRLEGVTPTLVQIHVWSGGTSATLQVESPLTPNETRSGLELRLQRASKLSGIVVDAQGQPLAGVPLVAMPTSGGSWGNGTSGEDGTFELSVAEGPYTLGVNAAPDTGALGPPQDPQAVQAPAANLRILARAVEKTLLTAKILLPDGTPVPLCTVRAGGDATRANQFGGFGESTNEVVGGEVRRVISRAPPFDVVVSSARGADGARLNLKSKTVRVDAAPANLTITLEAGLAVAGRVVDAQGQGLAGVGVLIGAVTARTDAKGRFRVEGLSEEGYSVRVTAPSGFAAPPPTTVAAGVDNLELVCTPGATITGRLLGAAGEPVTSGGVSANWPGGAVYAQVDAQGAFRVEGLPAEARVTLTTNCWSGEWASLRQATLTDVRAGTSDVVLRLERGALVTGIVHDAEGRPAPGKHVRASGKGGDAYAPTDGDGRFRFENLGAGPVTLVVVESSTMRAVSTPVETEAPSNGVRLVMQRRAFLRGRVVGEGLAGFRVVALPTGVQGSRLAPAAQRELAADGRFELEVYEGGTFDLSVSQRDDDRYAFLANARPGTELVLRLETGASIEGTVVRSDGKPLLDKVWVSASRPGWQAYAQVGEGGAFRVRGLPPGSYEVSAIGGDGTPGRPQTAEAGVSGLRFELSVP